MNAENVFDKATRIEQEIERKKEYISELNDLRLSATSKLTQDKVQSSPSADKIEGITIRILELEADVKELEKQLEEIQGEIEKIISNIENPIDYSVMYRRYILRNSVYEIADEMNRTRQWVYNHINNVFTKL